MANRIDVVGRKHPRLFYLASLRGCAKCWRQNRDWGRDWLVNVRSSTPGQLEGIFSLPGTEYLCLHKQQWWWHHWLENITRMKIRLERNWILLYLPRNLKQTYFNLVYQSGPPLVCCVIHEAPWDQQCDSPWFRLHPDTRKSLDSTSHALYSYYEVPLFEERTKTNIYFLSFYNTTLMKAWDPGSTLLEPYLFPIYSRCWRDQMVANHLSNHCSTHMRSGCR